MSDALDRIVVEDKGEYIYLGGEPKKRELGVVVGELLTC